MANNDALYTGEYHHGGLFVNKRRREYIGGIISYENGIDADETSLIEVKNFVKALGYGGDCRVWCRMHKNSLNRGLKLLDTDKSVYDVFLQHHLTRRVVLYIEHSVQIIEPVEDVDPSKLAKPKPT